MTKTLRELFVNRVRQSDIFRKILDGQARHLHFTLSHPDRFEQDDVKACRVQDAQGLGGRAGHPAEMTS